MKKLLLAVLMLAVIPMSVSASEHSWMWEHTVVLGDTGTTAPTQYDTSAAYRLDKGGSYSAPFDGSITGLYRQIVVKDRDSTWLDDTLRVITEVGATQTGPWTLFDTLAIGTAGGADTTVNDSTRMTLDSQPLRFANYFRVRFEHEDSLVVADTAGANDRRGNVYTGFVQIRLFRR